MKEATGEASLSVITVILIAAVLAAAAIILKNVMGKVNERANEAADGVITISEFYELDR